MRQPEHLKQRSLNLKLPLGRCQLMLLQYTYRNVKLDCKGIETRFELRQQGQIPTGHSLGSLKISLLDLKLR